MFVNNFPLVFAMPLVDAKQKLILNGLHCITSFYDRNHKVALQRLVFLTFTKTFIRKGDDFFTFYYRKQ
jgi:hypothetical protein